MAKLLLNLGIVCRADVNKAQELIDYLQNESQIKEVEEKWLNKK